MASEHEIFVLIEQFERRLRSLREICTDAQKQVEQLERENSVLQGSLKEQQDLVKQLRKKPVISEKNTPKSKDVGIIVKDNLSETDTKAELKQQLDEYIRELERCIAHLSSLS
ncbi:hypothetical protein [Spirosoma flavum]|uniref:Uncharacterized protein n=1 Tax=Spirosoma flavum TaxID=2048557 RepID=A0ABW6ARP4_9BACT